MKICVCWVTKIRYRYALKKLLLNKLVIFCGPGCCIPGSEEGGKRVKPWKGGMWFLVVPYALVSGIGTFHVAQIYMKLEITNFAVHGATSSVLFQMKSILNLFI